MPKRFVAIWFRYLKTDWFTIRQPALGNTPFVLSLPDHGRMVITAVNPAAQAEGIETGMVLADARVLAPSLKYLDDKPGFETKVLTALGKWCIRFTPLVAIDPPDGLILDASGCPHLWGSDEAYLATIVTRIKSLGYYARGAMADTIGAAWAVARFGKQANIINRGEQMSALLPLPPEALRLEPIMLGRFYKLGFKQVKHFIAMPRTVLRRRFGNELLKRIDQALGTEEEIIQPIELIEPYQERLPCLEPIITATGIEIALRRLLETLCDRLYHEQKGIRKACFKAYRIDNGIEKIEIGTNRGTQNIEHLFKLFEGKIETIEPGPGIELFVLEAIKVEDVTALQEKLWDGSCGLENVKLSELVDRLENKIGTNMIHRYLPDEHHWPERSFKLAASLQEKTINGWRTGKPRPVHLLAKPEPIQVTAPIPDYPPMLFRYKGKLHKILKADGPERIEREWWLEEGPHRDYYCAEDEEGKRYWLFRSGHYSADNNYQWFIHGFFA